MATIGTFKKSGNEFQGEIFTLSVQAKGVRIVPEAGRTGDNAPSHRIFVGRAEIGAAWSKRSAEGRDYLSVKLDDPSFNTPIYANLFDDEGGETFSLIWSRGRSKPTATDRRRHRPPGAIRAGLCCAGERHVEHSTGQPLKPSPLRPALSCERRWPLTIGDDAPVTLAKSVLSDIPW